MRLTFIETLCRLAEDDERIWLLCADLGYSVLEPFIEKFPSRFINVGVAEQNMVGVAAGLAMGGRKVFTYSIVNFATLRCLEQIRNDVCYHGLPVTVVSVGGGFSYGPQGYTHHGIEDIAVMRSLPNMAVMVPADPWETRIATERLAAVDGPGYLRLGRAREPALHPAPPKWTDGQPIVVRRGSCLLIIATGPLLGEAMQAVAATARCDAEIWSLPQIKPFPVAAVAAAAKRFRTIVTLEEARIEGGLGSAVAEVVAEQRTDTVVVRRGVDGTILERAYSQAAARVHYGLDANSLSAMLSGSGPQPAATA